jgi:H+/Cl- antiporter ClcA
MKVRLPIIVRRVLIAVAAGAGVTAVIASPAAASLVANHAEPMA